MPSEHPTPADFLSAAAPVASDGNSRWASEMAAEVRRVVRRASEYAPRSRQVHLGPSELGVECDRQVAWKLLQIPRTNHVADPWPSIVGTAVHVWLAEAFDDDNPAGGTLRWHTERRVVPHPDHAGTGDLYDAAEFAVLDHKVLGETTMAHIRSRSGPPRKYRAQLCLYERGYRNEGFQVDRVGIIAYPRTGSSIHGIYVWEDPADADERSALVDTVLADTQRRKDWAFLVQQGMISAAQVPIAPSDDECYFCPFYRPQSAHDGGAGCAGPRKDKQ